VAEAHKECEFSFVGAQYTNGEEQLSVVYSIADGHEGFK